MSMESLFRTAFWIIFGGMIVMQACFAFQARQTGTRKVAKCETIERDEGRKHAVVRASRAIALVDFLVMYAIDSTWLEVLRMPLPNWLCWIGGTSGAASLAFYA